ncbi:acyloxyacyl hydrolase [Pontibaca salina]|uniref:Acyloxyacyl hydrolase n=1 Tax=Pontibaca salina TaxID=2795731 RepID=A0A934M442_9RHOB|nr:acyloxyacyl hydrolase [Pontibaca salina]MBI6630509.1 acyloxyacyl hydrolase [Pontibaca salina]
MKHIPLCAAMIAAPLAAPAQEVILGAGFTDFSADEAQDTAVISLDYHHRPFLSNGRFDLGLGGALEIDAEADAFAGLGLVARYGFAERWFVNASVMPGAYFSARLSNDLGSTFQIRSLLGIGYELSDSSSLSLAISHKSNASTGDKNPGVNALTLRWHKKL